MEDVQQLLQKIEGEQNIFTKARLLLHLKVDKGMSIKDIAKALSTSSVSICSMLRLLRVPDIVSDGYFVGNISLTHLYILSRLKKEEEMVAAYEKVLAFSLTTAQTEMLVRQILFGVKTEGEHLSKEEKFRIEKYFSDINPLIKTEVIQTQKRARVVITVVGNLKKTTSLLQKLVQTDKDMTDD